MFRAVLLATFILFLASDCFAQCSNMTTCDACTDQPDCGWCGATGTCHNGTNKGPTDATNCPKAWQYQSCVDCSVHQYCAQCFLDDSCSWQTCDGTAQCNSYSPNITAGCLVSFQCKCEDYTDCEGCLVDDNCGWCGTNATCVTSTAAKLDSKCETVHTCKGGFSGGSFVGGIFLGAGLLAIAFVIAVFWYRRRRQQSYEVLSS